MASDKVVRTATTLTRLMPNVGGSEEGQEEVASVCG